MALETNLSRQLYTGNGVTRSFAFSFKVWSTGEIKVFTGNGTTSTDVTSSCSISINSNTAGGTVTFTTAPATGTKIAVMRSMPFIQEDIYLTGSRFDAHEIEDRFDQDCAERQQLKEELARCVKVNATSEYDETTMLAEELLKAESKASDAATKAEAALAATETARDTATATISAAATSAAVTAAATVTAEGTAQKAIVTAEGNYQAERIENLAEFEELASGLSCREATVKITTAIAKGDTYTLPSDFKYAVGHHHIRFAIEGVMLSNTWWEEVGDTDTVSTQVKFLMPIKAGRELNIWIAPLRYDYQQDPVLLARVVSLENALAELSRKVVYADNNNETNTTNS